MRSLYNPAQFTICCAREFTGGGFDDRPAVISSNAGDLGAGDHAATLFDDDLGEPAANAGVVDDAGLGHMDSTEPLDAIGLDLADLLGRNPIRRRHRSAARVRGASPCVAVLIPRPRR